MSASSADGGSSAQEDGHDQEYALAQEEAHAEAFALSATALDILTSRMLPFEACTREASPPTYQTSFSHIRTLLSHQAVVALERTAVILHMGNYVKDRRTGDKYFEPMSLSVRLGMHFLFYGTRQQSVLQWNLTRQLLRLQTIKMGAEYDNPRSAWYIHDFVDAYRLHSTLHELEEPDLMGYQTFNEFFARSLRPGVRPLDDPDDDLVSSSPADCRLMAYQTTDLATTYWIKGTGFSLSKLLDDEALAARFAGGAMVIARLAPQDYHRWHAPVSGTVQSVKFIDGAYYTVNPQAVNQPGTLDVFCENHRSVMLLNRDRQSVSHYWQPPCAPPIAIVAIGAMLVGSINYVHDRIMDRGTRVARGQCLGYFQYGGSTVVVLYPKGELVVDPDLHTNSTVEGCETRVAVNTRVGRAEEYQERCPWTQCPWAQV